MALTLAEMLSATRQWDSCIASVPGNVADAVEEVLAKVPANRFSSAREFADALTNPVFTLSATSVAMGGREGDIGDRAIEAARLHDIVPRGSPVREQDPLTRAAVGSHLFGTEKRRRLARDVDVVTASEVD